MTEDEDRPPAIPAYVRHKRCVRCREWLALYHVMDHDTLELEAVCPKCLTPAEKYRNGKS